MMSIKKHPVLFLFLILAAAAMACNLPNSGSADGTETPSAATQIAQTVEMNLTQTASVAMGTPPVITVPPTVTLPALLTATPASATSTPAPAPCDRAQFVADVTIPDGTEITAGQTFVKTWRLMNNGTCTWTTNYSLVFDNGEAMNGPVSIPLTASVAPGQMIDLSVQMKAPDAPGEYRGDWRLRNASNAKFGVGTNAESSFYVLIKVVGSATATATVPASPVVRYNFVTNYCSAEWISGAGALPCPGGTGDASGFVLKLDNPKLENGLFAGEPALETHPEWVDNGVITGKFPAINVENGYRFKAQIGCLNGAADCDVKFQFNYRSNGGPLQTFGTWQETNDGAIQSLNIDLSSLAGSSVQFVLAVQSNGSSGQDWALWINPRIEK